MATKQTIKGWFSNGKKPTQEQFWTWIESYRHSDEKLILEDVQGLSEVINNKAEQLEVINIQNELYPPVDFVEKFEQELA